MVIPTISLPVNPFRDNRCGKPGKSPSYMGRLGLEAGMGGIWGDSRGKTRVGWQVKKPTKNEASHNIRPH